MTEYKRKITLDQAATYEIKVPGKLNPRWSNWNDEMSVTVDSDVGDLPVTTLTSTLDQAALQGLLRRLYSLGLPLISVNYIEVG